MTTRNALREPPPLPANIDDWTRHIKAERTLNDLVEDIHRLLVENERYRSLLRATYDAHAVEGSLSMDNALVAMMIREKAREIGSEIAAPKPGHPQGEPLAVINLALGVVLRRYKMSRKQRRNMVEGEIVPPEENGD